MKIEKISESQVKFILNHSDLTDRDIKLTELAFGTDKVQLFFREMMDQAMQECGFQAENSPLMIEAVPIPTEGIMIIVTKVAGVNEAAATIEPLPVRERTQPKAVIDFSQKPVNNENISIFSFGSLDEAATASGRLSGIYSGSSSLYKDKNRYLLILENTAPDGRLTWDGLNAILCEYGQKHISNAISKSYLEEHSELLIKSSAIDALVKII